MRKGLILGITASIVILGCSKGKSNNCPLKLAGNYTASVYENGVAEDKEQIVITAPTANPKQIQFCEQGTDDTLVADIDCGASTFSFLMQAEIPELVKGKGSFTLSSKTVQFYLLTVDAGKSDSMAFVLTQP